MSGEQIPPELFGVNVNSWITQMIRQWIPVLSKVDDFATFKKVEVYAKYSTF